MLDRIKNRVSRLFLEDEPEEIKEEPNHQQKFQTKMMYQYPTKSSFRFPVIPDEEQSKQDPLDIPAYQRRQRERRQDVLINDNNENMIEKEKRRFVPTEVPSPIYGYQKYKKRKEIEDVPAFVRKQQKNKSDIVEQQERHQDSNRIDSYKREVEEQIVPQKSISIEKPTDEKRDPQDQNPKENNDLQPSRQINEQTRQSKRLKNRRKDRKSFHNERKKSQANPVPFNVMMSANDKRYLKEKENKNHITDQKYHGQNDHIQQIDRAFPAHLLNDPEIKTNEDIIWVQEQQKLLEETLKHFNVKAKVVNATQGPSVTRFEVQPELGVKVSRVRNLNDDIKLNMAAKDIRIEAPIPGKNTIGIEVPNLKPQMVGLQEILEAPAFQQSKSPLTIGLGLNVEGQPLVTNISKMPHGLIAGATGSGKSVCINTILISLLYKANHEDVKFLLIDPKMVELAPYNGIPHLVAPVITDVKAATAALKWAVNEMEDRYEKFVHEGVRDIERYNEKMNKENRQTEKLPFMVIVIDELADLMMISPQDVEDAISRIAQKARACGMHLLLATQRPSVDVITGLIKANIPTRIAFSVSSQVDSRTIIDTSGAERLLGKGDMLLIENGSGKSVRLQGAFVSDEEIERVTNHARSIASPNYLFEQEQLLLNVETEEEDELLAEVIDFVVNQNQASTSLLQRQFRIGYNRAARLIDHLEGKGIISGQNGSKPRDVLISDTQLEEI